MPNSTSIRRCVEDFLILFLSFISPTQGKMIIGLMSNRNKRGDNFLKSRIEDGVKDSDELHTQVYVEQMGPETRNRVRGYENGVTPDLMPYALGSISRSSKRASKTREAFLESKCLEMKTKHEAMQKELEELWAQQQQQQMMKMLMNVMQS